MSNNGLTIKYLINLLNDQTDLKINRQQYLIDSFPTLKVGSLLTCDNMLTALLIAYKNAHYDIDDLTYRINIDPTLIKTEKDIIQKTLFESGIDAGKKKKFIGLVSNLTNPTNEFMLILTYHFGINILVYQTESQTTKCFYWDNQLDRDLPFIIIKETKETNSPYFYYELVFSQNKFIFEFNHPIITELMPVAFIVGLEHNKQLEYLKLDKVNEVMTEIEKPVNQVEQTDFEQTESELTQNMNNKSYYNTKIKLKMIPFSTLKIIEELQTMNFDPISLD
jgi:hypothetical protein